MTTIKDLPKEVLSLTFRNLTLKEQVKCQYVCRSWYLPLHLLILETVYLWDDDLLEKFLASVDQNPNPSYLSGVKRLRIERVGNSYERSVKFNTELLHKLFYRFQSLQHVVIDSLQLLNLFNKNICKTMLEKCQKLDTFEVNCYNPHDRAKYTSSLCRVRLLLTKLDIDHINIPIDSLQDVVDYILQFPRLRQVDGPTCYIFRGFEGVLPLFERLRHLQSFTFGQGYDPENLDDAYFATKTKDEQDTIRRRLSNVTDLRVQRKESFCTTTMTMAAKYFTHLKTLNFKSRRNETWSDQHRQVFCNEIARLLCSATAYGLLSLHRMDCEELSRCLPSIMRKVFQQTTSTRILHIFSADRYSDHNFVDFTLYQTQRMKKMNITFTQEENVDFLMLNMFDTSAPQSDIDVFILDLAKHNEDPLFHGYATCYTFDNILGHMTSLKAVILDIPEFANEEAVKYDFVPKLPLVEDVVMRSLENEDFQRLLDRFSVMFPNIKNLYLFYYGGFWNPDDGQYQVDLKEYSLKSLTIDLTNVKRELLFIRKKYYLLESDFFVVKVSCIENGAQHIYKIPVKDSPPTFIDESDLTESNYHYPVHITIRSVQELQLLLQIGNNEIRDCESVIDSTTEEDNYENYDDYERSEEGDIIICKGPSDSEDEAYYNFHLADEDFHNFAISNAEREAQEEDDFGEESVDNSGDDFDNLSQDSFSDDEDDYRYYETDFVRYYYQKKSTYYSYLRRIKISIPN